MVLVSSQIVQSNVVNEMYHGRKQCSLRTYMKCNDASALLCPENPKRIAHRQLLSRATLEAEWEWDPWVWIGMERPICCQPSLRL
jgi:hypothetical protein